MNPGVRIFKQLLIAGIILAVLGFAGFRVARNVNPPTPTPTPDPRASLLPLEVLETDVLEISQFDYDVVAKIKNPNASYGSPRVQYLLDLQNADGEVTQDSGSFYILPGQTKYLLFSPLATNKLVSHAVLTITTTDWQKLDALAANNVSLVVTGTQLFSNPSKLRGTVLNNSDFDLSQADVTVMLLDADQHPIAANRTEIRTFLAKTSRGFEVSWDSPLPPTATVYVEATTNLFENSTFLRTYGSPIDTRQF